MKKPRYILKICQESPLLPWAALFLALALAVTQFGGTNARSRIAALRAMTEGHVLTIDSYVDWTFDWSLAPNGHYYSNKAPGGALLGLPAFALLDYPTRLPNKKIDAQGRAPEPGYLQLTLFNLLMQLLPFAFLVLYAGRKLQERGVSSSGLHFFALAAFFGNTAAIYMNCYFGHGLAALLFLAAMLAWLERRYAWASFFFAATMLTDYAGACVIPFFLLATFWRERNGKIILPIALGAAPIALLWIWYHWVAFGSPFAVASQFINTTQLVHVEGSENLWGTVGIFPIPGALKGLLFGSERGILFTQPWILAVIPLLFFPKSKELPSGSLFLFLGGFLGVLWMNSSVGAWYGGHAIGPRYLALAFPAFALMIAWRWNELPEWARSVLWVTLGIALVFRILIYPFSNLAPMENLWLYHAGKFFEAHAGTAFLRLGIALTLSAATLLWVKSRRAAA
ncbi:MAG: hypothetical protein AB7K68_07175 [Bacteriovoracia bacterium]